MANAGEQAPTTVIDKAQNVVDLMARSTEEVLDKSDKLTVLAEDMERQLGKLKGLDADLTGRAEETLSAIKAAVYDIIASQSYQDVVRQKMENMIVDVNQIRDWLIEGLVVLNSKKDRSPENILKKTQILKEVKKPSGGPLKQDLVDDLLAEFGF